MANLELALNNLERFLDEPIVSDRDRAGVLQAFEYTFELSWKAAQKIAADQGLSAQSPRQALKAAFQLGLIPLDEEETWLSMLNDRNRTVHTYRAELAQEIFERVRDRYQKALAGLLLRARSMD
ncbi:MAG: nucleotidyltransferase substrate binding protein [Deltaproteobacteria bacterium]|nr:nucleotidyltransferase substrate binding protein [Deltaproteobacteria bacterium]